MVCIDQWSEPASGYVVVSVSGTFTLDKVAPCRAAIDKALLDGSTVIVDLTEVRAVRPICLTAFPAELAAHGGWPWAKLAFVGLSPQLRTMLARSRILDLIPAFDGVAQAVHGVEERPRLVRRGATLHPIAAAPGQARAILDECCTAWSIPAPTRPVAGLVISELVTNAVRHADTDITIGAACTPTGFYVDVRDSCPTQPVFADPGATAARGHGLGIVRALSDHCGVTPHPHGKTVWARFRVRRTQVGPGWPR